MNTALLTAQTDLLQVDSQREIPLDGAAVFVAFHPSAPLLVVGTSRSLSVFQTNGHAELSIDPCPHGGLTAGAASRDGSLLAIGCEDGSIVYAHWDGSILNRRLQRGHTKRVTSVAFAPVGSYLVSIGEDKLVKVWNTIDGTEIRRFGNGPKKAYIFAGFSTSGLTILAVTRDGHVCEWDTKTGRAVRRLTLDENSVFSAAINNAGKLLAVGGEFAGLNKGSWQGPINPADFYRSDRLLILDLKQGVIAKHIDGIDGQLRALSFSSDNRFLAVIRQRAISSYLSIFDVQRGVEILTQPSDGRAAVSQFSQDGAYLASISPDGQLRLMRMSGVQLSAESGDLAGQRIRATSTSAEPLLTGNSGDTLAIMDLDSLGVDKSVGRTVAEMLRNQIVGAGVKVVAGDRMQEIIRAQNFGVSDRTDPATAIALGRILSANRILFGSVSALGSNYTVNVQLVNVQTAQIRGIREVLCQRCSVEDLPSVVFELKVLIVGNP